MSLRLIFVIALFMFSATCRAQVLESNETLKVDASPSLNPWQQLEDMPGNLGRYALASDQERIYQLGGIAFKIVRGKRYGHQFAAYDPTTQKWEKLPNAPHGTGSAHLAWWPAKQCILMIGGIKKLGDRFSSDGLKLGAYSVADKRWSTRIVRTPGLGRVAAMIHLDADRFLLISGDDGLNAHRSAILDMSTGKPSVENVGSFPKSGRVLGVERTSDTIVVLQNGAQNGSRLQRFSATSGKHIDSVELSVRCEWTDKIVTWRGNLLIWKNAAPAHSDSYQHASRMMMVDPTTGTCETLHPQYPGPIARRSSNGIVLGDSFYAFGGQRDDNTWLKDVHRYSFRSSESSSTAGL